MEQQNIGDNISRYRKEIGLSQEKIAEYMEVSRQAVTKWENNMSKPSTDNLIHLAEILNVSVEDLLGNKKEENEQSKENYKNSNTPWIFIVVSLICLVVYIGISILQESFRVGTLICMFILVIPNQTFLHIYFTHAIGKDSFSAIAGFDSNVEYDYLEVKKLLTQLDIHIGASSAVFTFLFCVLNLFARELVWMNGILILLYVVEFMFCILIENYKFADKIYLHEQDKKMSLKSMPFTMLFVGVLVLGMGITFYIFESRGIENNTMPALKLAGLLLLGEGIATIGYLLESSRLKKWDILKVEYKTSLSFKICIVISIIMLCVMFIV